jgi:hypothetical protein
MAMPLKRILDAIRGWNENAEPVEKTALTGGCVDTGLSSKEAADTVPALEFPWARLAGNREDMAVRLFGNIKNARNGRDDRHIWLNSRGFGAWRRLLAGTGRRKEFGIAFDFGNWGRKHGEQADNCLPYKKCLDFLFKLKHSRQESLNCRSAPANFRFFRSLPRIGQTLGGQPAKKFEEFQNLLNASFRRFGPTFGGSGQFGGENSLARFKRGALRSAERACLWLRDYSFRFACEGGAIVRGRAPTVGRHEKFGEDSPHAAPGHETMFKKYVKNSRPPFIFRATGKPAVLLRPN